MTQSPYQHQDPRRIDLQRLIDQAERDGDTQRLARLELQWVHRFGVDSLPIGINVAASGDVIEMAAVTSAVTSVAVDDATAHATTADHRTADFTATESLPDSVASVEDSDQPMPSVEASSSTLSEPELQLDQDEQAGAGSGFSRFTTLLKDCLDDVGRVVDLEVSASSDPLTPQASSPRPVPASGPRRLRRWLAPVDADDLPKAS